MIRTGTTLITGPDGYPAQTWPTWRACSLLRHRRLAGLTSSHRKGIVMKAHWPMPTGLRGKVVLIGFWTYTCINWIRSLPYVRAIWTATAIVAAEPVAAGRDCRDGSFREETHATDI